jgi:drug/metabolite transporter (DMT)-like permease
MSDATTHRGGGLAVAAAVGARAGASIFAKTAALSAVGGGMLTALISPWYLAALACLFGQSVFWVLALRRLPLNVAYPFLALSIPINLTVAHVVFNEAINGWHLLGGACIVAGVALCRPPRTKTAPEQAQEPWT